MGRQFSDVIIVSFAHFHKWNGVIGNFSTLEIIINVNCECYWFSIVERIDYHRSSKLNVE